MSMMHRRGGGKFRGGNRPNQGGFQSGRFSDEHDNRTNINFSKTNRRVSFKTSGRLNKSIDDMKIRAYLENDDEMGSEIRQSTSDGHRRPKGRFIRKGSPIPRGMGGGGKLIQHPAGWYMVTITQGGKYDRETLLRLLISAMAPTTFNAQFYRVDRDTNAVQFYLDDFDVAEKILRQDKKIELPDGFKMIIRVRGSVPQTRVDDSLKERMKLAMVKRYNAQTKAMDLTKFHGDPDFNDIFCALARPQVMTSVIDIIAENIPDLEAINLNDNKLGLLDHFKVMSSKLPNLKILYLGNNKIFTISSLDVFKSLPIVELFLEGNPCKKRFKDNASYVSEIKKKFPKLVKLDGSDLGPSIGFDVAEEEHIKLPLWKQAYFCHENGQELAATFLKQYFAIYDSDNRQQLLEAYHENAMFSITATSNQHYTREEILSNYWKIGRNMKHPKANDYKLISLKRGKLAIVALLNDLPPSRHDLNSFAVDLTFFTPQMIVLTVTGLFKERSTDPKAEHSRIFQKTLVIVPNNGGFCIKNEMLHINNATPAQSRNAFKTPAPQVAPPTIASPTTSIQPLPASSGTPDDSTKMKMIQAMSQQSNMNVEWSRKCLEETNWDFARAGFVFGELFKQNKIPPEAFVK